MAEELGTRVKQSFRQLHPPGERLTRSFTRDLGLTKRVTASLTFGSGRITGANGTFTNTFAVGDPVWVESGAVVNGGAFFTVTGLDAVNAAYLAVDPAPAAEGPVSATVRTPG